MAEQICPECGCKMTDNAFEKEGIVYCCPSCANSCQCTCGCLEEAAQDCR